MFTLDLSKDRILISEIKRRCFCDDKATFGFCCNFVAHSRNNSTYILPMSAELAGSQSCHLAEHFVEVGGVIEAAVGGNIKHIAVVVFAEHRHRKLNAFRRNIIPQ